MGINIADNFAYNGKKPLDNRTEYATLSAMKSVVDANINEGCLAYNKEDGKYYKFLSTNTVDATTGKWREFETGGGGQTYNDFTGATSSTAGAHGLVPAPSAGDEGKVLFGNGAWGALPSVDLSVLSNEAFQFSPIEKPVGTWTDSNNVTKILYAKTVDFGALPNNNVKTVAHGISDIEKICGIEIITKGDNAWRNAIISKAQIANQLVHWANTTEIALQTGTNYSTYTADVTLFYTKTTDSPLPSDVKFAGVTSDGEVIYEKSITPSSPFQFGTTNAWTNVVAVDNAMNGVISVDCYDSGTLRNPPVLFKPNNGYLQYWNVDNNSNLQYYTISKFVVKFTKTS